MQAVDFMNESDGKWPWSILMQA